MKCVICHGDNIIEKEVNEEIRKGNDILFVPIKINVCMTCGERYYDRRIMKMLEHIDEQFDSGLLKLKESGKVLLYESVNHAN